MSSEQPSSDGSVPPTRGRGRGRGKSRGGLGKYLRARGRGRGGGRPAEFQKRLVLEEEEIIELETDSEEAKELARKYARRQLQSNADRYAEPEPDVNSDGEAEKDPEVDLSSFLARQRLDDNDASSNTVVKDTEDDSDIDKSLAHLIPNSSEARRSHKGKLQSIEWNDELEEIRKEKEIADANRELKNRFKANTDRQKMRRARGGLTTQARERKKEKEAVLEAPPLPTDEAAAQESEIEKMEDFLDDLLT